MFCTFEKELCQRLCHSCRRTSFSNIMYQRVIATKTREKNLLFPVKNLLRTSAVGAAFHTCKTKKYMFGHQIFLSGWDSLQACLLISNCKHQLRTHPEILQHRQYHSHSVFTLKNPLFDSYLQSLRNEYELLKNGKNQFYNETEENKYMQRFQFLQMSCDSAQSLYDLQKEIEELNQLVKVEEDVEMKTLLEKEIISFESKLTTAEEEMIDILVGDDPADDNGVVLEVSAGVGGQEAMLFCAEVFNMYCNYSLAKGWDVSIVNRDEVELGGYRKASIDVNGLDVYKYLKHEAGVHRVQRIPKTEKAGRIHTSTVSVSVLPQPREVDVIIDKKDLKVETFRGSGPGGQSVNTTDSAVRITHIPTGIVSECKQERSQIKNKDIAMKRLKMRIYQEQLEKEEAERQVTRKMQMGTRGRSEKIRTYNFQQDRVTDHRVKESQSNLADFMAGGDSLEDMILKVARDYTYQMLESMLDEFEMSLKKKKH